MDFLDFQDMMRAWERVKIARNVEYSLFTFGDSELPYYLLCEPNSKHPMVVIKKGEIKITRPIILAPGDRAPEFEDFFEDREEENIASFLMSRTAAFSNLKITNRKGVEKIVSDQMEEALDKLNKQLDDQEEDRIAILTAPRSLTGVALLKYVTERIMRSTPDNIQELRERGFLP